MLCVFIYDKRHCLFVWECVVLFITDAEILSPRFFLSICDTHTGSRSYIQAYLKELEKRDIIMEGDIMERNILKKEKVERRK